jgi:hypothetical protein
MNTKKVVFIFIFLTVLYLIIEVQPILLASEDNMLTTSDIESSIHSKYLGDIRNIQLTTNSEKNMYIVNLLGRNWIYNLKVDAYSGDVLYLEKVASDNMVTVENQAIGSISYGNIVNGKRSLDISTLNCSF